MRLLQRSQEGLLVGEKASPAVLVWQRPSPRRLSPCPCVQALSHFITPAPVPVVYEVAVPVPAPALVPVTSGAGAAFSR